MTDVITAPFWGGVVPHMTDNWQDLPDTPTPFYVYAREGFYLHSRNVTGRWITKTHKTPSKLKALGNASGIGVFDAPIIPADIYAQAVAFFRRVYRAHHTEAEVIITQHQETKAYRLYVPTQRVSHGGVYSIYDPRTIDRAYLTVGTFHSHCDFSAYHSSTDEGDARDMDGIHGTIGFLEREQPELALMVASNGTFFNFKDVTEVVDTSDLSAGTAPAWWDRYMVFGTVADDQRPAWADDDTWDRYMGRYKKPVQVPTNPNRPPPWNKPQTPFPANDWDQWYDGGQGDWMTANGYVYDPEIRTYRWIGTGSALSRESLQFNRGRMHLLPTAPKWNKDDGALIMPDKEPEDAWEDALGKDFIDGLFETGLFTDEDLEAAVTDAPESMTKEYWVRAFTEKLFTASDWLVEQGEDIKLTIKRKPRPAKGQITVDEHIAGVIS